MKTALLSLAALLVCGAGAAHAQWTTSYYAAPVTTYYGGTSYAPAAYAPAMTNYGYGSTLSPRVAYYAPVPTTTYYAPAASYAGTTTYYAPSVPSTSYYAPSAEVVSTPVTTYYAPSTTYAPMTSYYGSSVPATSYYSGGGYSTYYAPYSTYYSQPVIVSPKVYVPGQPVRNMLRAVTP